VPDTVLTLKDGISGMLISLWVRISALAWQVRKLRLGK
jgi:hypothetical protein